jgi:MarR family transcriptional regulator, organic hydroperoxide resistance regulator
MNKILDGNEIIDLRLLLRRTEEAIQNARREELRKYKITPENAAVLHIITDLGGSARPLELSKWLSRKLHTVHGLLERMEKAGLIEKVNDPSRKNGVRVILTEEGKVLFEYTRQLLVPRKIFSTLSEDQREQFRGFLQILLERAREETGETEEVRLRPAIGAVEPLDQPDDES